jgi:hypothetical protein
MKKIIRLTESDLARIVKRIIIEEEEMTTNDNWVTIKNRLKLVTDSDGNNPKTIDFKYKNKPMTTLNWGNKSDQGKRKNWGLGIGSDGNLVFITSDEIQSKIFENQWGVKTDFNSLSKNYSSKSKIDFSNPSNVISKIKKTILSLG